VAAALACTACVVSGAACSTDDERPAPSPSASPTTSTAVPSTTASPDPTVEATLGCGPTDATEVTVSARDVGTEPVVIELRWEGTAYDRTTPMTGPLVGATIDPSLPSGAYEAGEAEVRIVAAADPGTVIARDVLDLRLTGGCG
jgi:hypothetical protein